ncbi:lycopene cyclase domain-containing protein [Jatrophihabitans telluris]|uniref:Lycopene cyclase domain-containing protein n=1 Tax=Jatrophihabitans telluris TaxID=2038343 RepID=A0ABY4QSW2_9ACTN|nr:lycopene cyclase domain-containing protein [Jatrophihabitans telluris]UQX86861.1 lycopene cyclase domain-containing protein [Jatrophihabitans telluris]
MTYTVLAVAAVLIAVTLDLVVLGTRLLRTRAFWLSYAIILAFQLLVNGILTGYHIVTYNPTAIIGVRIAYAPIEDIAFGFAMTVNTLIAWIRLRSSPDTLEAGGADGHPAPVEARNETA